MLPRIEQWVMEMQELDFALVYEPGKVEVPLPEQEVTAPESSSDGP